jgi:DNA-binding MarR family transcriptional regulator
MKGCNLTDAPNSDAVIEAPRLRSKSTRLQASGLGDQVGFGLRFAQAAVWSDLTATLAPFDLRPHQYAALLIVSEGPGCKQQEIGDALGIFRSNLVALIEDLSARGLISRAVKPEDRRSYSLALTDKGAALMDRADAAHAAHGARVAKALEPYEPRHLLEMLHSLAALGGGGEGA